MLLHAKVIFACKKELYRNVQQHKHILLTQAKEQSQYPLQSLLYFCNISTIQLHNISSNCLYSFYSRRTDNQDTCVHTLPSLLTYYSVSIYQFMFILLNQVWNPLTDLWWQISEREYTNSDKHYYFTYYVICNMFSISASLAVRSTYTPGSFQH